MAEARYLLHHAVTFLLLAAFWSLFFLLALVFLPVTLAWVAWQARKPRRACPQCGSPMEFQGPRSGWLAFACPRCRQSFLFQKGRPPRPGNGETRKNE